MDALQDLIGEIERIQCLVCALRGHRAEGRGAIPLPVLRERLRISQEECGRVVTRLTAEGLFEAVPDPAAPPGPAVRLTARGLRYLEQWSASLGARRADAGE